MSILQARHTEKLTIYLTEDALAKLRAEAERSGIPVASLARAALLRGLPPLVAEIKRDLRRAARKGKR